MKNPLQSFMQRATDLTRAGQLKEALAELQAGLGISVGPYPARNDEPKPGEEHLHAKEIHGEHVHADSGLAQFIPIPPAFYPHEPVHPQPPPQPPPSPPIHEDIVVDSGPSSFTDGAFALNGKTHHYKLFIPGGAAMQARPMVVMLHGCTQDPDDFALGTDMNNIAGAAGWVVLYPAQPVRANHTKCWNWFKAGTEPGAGEPAWIAALTRRTQEEQRIDPDRIFIAGLSAGAAMAMLTAELFPALYKGVGVHSGLAANVAGNVIDALSVMKRGPRTRQKRFHAADSIASNRVVPAIVFHGDADKTVHPENAVQIIEDVVAHAKQAEPGVIVGEIENKGAAGGMSYTQTIYRGSENRPLAEYWRLHGAGHAWSGGNERGSHTSARGPGASAEFLRFFDAVTRRH